MYYLSMYLFIQLYIKYHLTNSLEKKYLNPSYT